MRKKSNKRKTGFLDKIITASIDSDEDLLTEKCKFNFSYMDFSQKHGQSFKEWNHDQLYKLLDKLNNYSKFPLKHWSNESIGKGSNKVFEVYGTFPNKSEFIHPKHVPHQVNWARFRLESDMRLVGFIVPDEYHDVEFKYTKCRFDSNVFYIVFLDANHKFYLTK